MKKKILYSIFVIGLFATSIITLFATFAHMLLAYIIMSLYTILIIITLTNIRKWVKISLALILTLIGVWFTIVLVDYNNFDTIEEAQFAKLVEHDDKFIYKGFGYKYEYINFQDDIHQNEEGIFYLLGRKVVIWVS